MLRARRILLPLQWLALLAAGCSFLKARSDPTRYYVLTASASERAAPPPTVTVGLERVELPEYLVRPELVMRSGSNQIRIDEYQVWGEPLKDSFARTLRRDLEKQLNTRVAVAPFDPTAKPDVTVEVEVQRFERVEGQGAVLEARWTLRDEKHGTTLAQGIARERRPFSEKDTPAAVAALSGDVSALANDVAAAVRADDRKRREARANGATRK